MEKEADLCIFQGNAITCEIDDKGVSVVVKCHQFLPDQNVFRTQWTVTCDVSKGHSEHEFQLGGSYIINCYQRFCKKPHFSLKRSCRIRDGEPSTTSDLAQGLDLYQADRRQVKLVGSCEIPTQCPISSCFYSYLDNQTIIISNSVDTLFLARLQTDKHKYEIIRTICLTPAVDQVNWKVLSCHAYADKVLVYGVHPDNSASLEWYEVPLQTPISQEVLHPPRFHLEEHDGGDINAVTELCMDDLSMGDVNYLRQVLEIAVCQDDHVVVLATRRKHLMIAVNGRRCYFCSLPYDDTTSISLLSMMSLVYFVVASPSGCCIVNIKEKKVISTFDTFTKWHVGDLIGVGHKQLLLCKSLKKDEFAITDLHCYHFGKLAHGFDPPKYGGSTPGSLGCIRSVHHALLSKLQIAQAKDCTLDEVCERKAKLLIDSWININSDIHQEASSPELSNDMSGSVGCWIRPTAISALECVPWLGSYCNDYSVQLKQNDGIGVSRKIVAFLSDCATSRSQYVRSRLLNLNSCFAQGGKTPPKRLKMDYSLSSESLIHSCIVFHKPMAAVCSGLAVAILEVDPCMLGARSGGNQLQWPRVCNAQYKPPFHACCYSAMSLSCRESCQCLHLKLKIAVPQFCRQVDEAWFAFCDAVSSSPVQLHALESMLLSLHDKVRIVYNSSASTLEFSASCSQMLCYYLNKLSLLLPQHTTLSALCCDNRRRDIRAATELAHLLGRLRSAVLRHAEHPAEQPQMETKIIKRKNSNDDRDAITINDDVDLYSTFLIFQFGIITMQEALWWDT